MMNSHMHMERQMVDALRLSTLHDIQSQSTFFTVNKE